MSKTKIGYFVPEFPGQTHAFFWREMKRLRELGIEPEVVSTRRPPKSIISHAWAEEAMANTTYLFPPTIGAGCKALGKFFVSGPPAWTRVVRSILTAEGVTMKQRARMGLLAMIGAQLANIARQRDWQHIHVHSCADAANIAMFAKHIGGVPYSLTLHGDMGGYGPNQKQKWRNSEFTIVITQTLLDEVHDRLVGHFPNATPIAPMGVDVDSFTRAIDYTPWMGNGPLRVFTCGRLNPGKGHEYVIQAIAGLRDRGIEAHLKIAGAADSSDDTYFKLLESTIADLNLQSQVELMGAVSEDQVHACLEEAHVFALASIHEALGVAYMEAMAMQLPVVATKTGGVGELVDDGHEGLMVSVRSADEITDALERIAVDPELARDLGQAGYEKVRRDYHSGVSAEVLAQHILGTPRLKLDEPTDEFVETRLPKFSSTSEV